MKVSLPNLKLQDLIPIDVGRLQDNSTTDFDLYVQVGDHTVVYGNPGYHWRRDELEYLLKAGFSKLYYNKLDESKYKSFLMLNQFADVDKNLPPSERIVAIDQLATDFVKALYQEEITLPL